MNPIRVPPALAHHASRLTLAWQQAIDRREAAAKEYADAETAHLKAERELREAARAIALVIATSTPATSPATHPHTPTGPDPSAIGDTIPAGDVITAWMQAGMPTTPEGNMDLSGIKVGGQ